MKPENIWVLILCLVLVGGSVLLGGCDAPPNNNPYYRSGQRAHRLGVPAHANPSSSNGWGIDWLDGWMDAEEGKSNE